MTALRAGSLWARGPVRTAGGSRAPLDPLAALDGEDTLQETDNPSKILELGKPGPGPQRLGLRDAGRPMMPPNARTIPDVDLGAKPVPSAPFAPAPPFAPPSPFPAARRAAAVPAFGAGDFPAFARRRRPLSRVRRRHLPHVRRGSHSAGLLDELSALIPRLPKVRRTGNERPAANGAPPPLPAAAAPLLSPTTPRRGDASAHCAAAPRRPAPCGSGVSTLAPAR